MRIYIVEDDTSVIGILEDIVEGNELGVVCGDSGGEPANLGQILALDPDLVLVDLLMPQKDGIQVVRELKEQGCRAKFIMISQVSNKEMVAKAYLAGVDFFINKPINLIEVRQVILNVRRQLENERDLHTIQSVFAEKAAPVGRRSRLEAQRKRIQTTLSQLGMAGEKGARDIVELRGLTKSHVCQSVDGLTRRGWLSGVQDGQDRRRVHLSLLPAAQTAVAAAQAVQRDFFVRLYRGVSQEERETLERVQEKMLSNLKEAQQ